MNKKLLLLSVALTAFNLSSCGANNQVSEEMSNSTISDEVNSVLSEAVSQEETSVSETTSVEEASSPSEQLSSVEESPSTEISSNIVSEEPVEENVLYVGPNAGFSSKIKGTIDDPMRLQNAIINSKPGTTIIMLDGTYKYDSPVEASKEKELYPASSMEEGKTIIALNKGQVKLDFSNMLWNSANRGLKINSNYWTVKDLEVFGAGDNGIYIGGNHNLIENCVTHDNGDTGLQLGRAYSSQTTIADWPSYNTIKNCTSYDNHDPKGEDSDGFACKLTTGVGNVFDGCIAYNNVDDGWDLYTKGDTGAIGPVTLINCVAFNNGVTSGQNTNGVPYGTSNSDGNGFKLGGETIAVNHIVKNCVAFNNLACGFTDNSNPGTINIENCTSYNNGVRDTDANNFDMCRNVDTSINYYKGLLSYCDTNVDFRTGASKKFNSKDEYKGTVVDSIFYCGRTTLRFVGVDVCDYSQNSLRGEIFTSSVSPFISNTIPNHLANIHELLRDENGNVNLGEFLKVNPEYVSSSLGEGKTVGANLG